MMGCGYFNPLTGYMNVADAMGVAENMKTTFLPSRILNSPISWTARWPWCTRRWRSTAKANKSRTLFQHILKKEIPK